MHNIVSLTQNVKLVYFTNNRITAVRNTITYNMHTIEQFYFHSLQLQDLIFMKLLDGLNTMKKHVHAIGRVVPEP